MVQKHIKPRVYPNNLLPRFSPNLLNPAFPRFCADESVGVAVGVLGRGGGRGRSAARRACQDQVRHPTQRQAQDTGPSSA